MSEIHIGPHTRDEAKEHDVTETFDREINVKGIAWAVGGLVAATVVVHLLMLWLVEGFERFDRKRDVRPTPIEAAMPQGLPPEPRLQIDDNLDMRQMREAEDRALTQPAWADRAQGRARVPLEDAMEVIVQRGLGADVVGGQLGAAPSTPQMPGATVQMSRPVVPAQPPGRPPL